MANKKFTDLTVASSLAGTDILAVTTDPSGTPVSNKATITALMALAPVQQRDITPLATQVSLGNHESLTQAHGISAFGASLVDDADAATARTTLDVDQAGTDNSTDVTLATVANNYLSLSGQEITAGIVPVSLGGTGSGDLATARANLGLGTAATTASTDYATAAQGTKADTALQSVSAGALSDFDFDDNAIKGFSAEVPTEKTADHTLTNDDNGTVVVMNSGSAIKVIVPSGLATGFNCSVIQKGAGQVEFDNNSGASTINNRQSHTKINGQYGVASIVAYATDTYILAGDTAS